MICININIFNILYKNNSDFVISPSVFGYLFELLLFHRKTVFAFTIMGCSLNIRIYLQFLFLCKYNLLFIYKSFSPLLRSYMRFSETNFSNHKRKCAALKFYSLVMYDGEICEGVFYVF